MADEKALTIDGKPISDLRVVDLKKELEKNNLSKSGSKKELLDRLKSHLSLERLREKSLLEGDQAPSLQLKDVGQNEFMKQYIQQRELMFAEQMQEKKKIVEEEKRKRESASEDEGRDQTSQKLSNDSVSEDDNTSKQAVTSASENEEMPVLHKESRRATPGKEAPRVTPSKEAPSPSPDVGRRKLTRRGLQELTPDKPSNQREIKRMDRPTRRQPVPLMEKLQKEFNPPQLDSEPPSQATEEKRREAKTPLKETPTPEKAAEKETPAPEKESPVPEKLVSNLRVKLERTTPVKDKKPGPLDEKFRNLAAKLKKDVISPLAARIQPKPHESSQEVKSPVMKQSTENLSKSTKGEETKSESLPIAKKSKETEPAPKPIEKPKPLVTSPPKRPKYSHYSTSSSSSSFSSSSKSDSGSSDESSDEEEPTKKPERKPEKLEEKPVRTNRSKTEEQPRSAAKSNLKEERSSVLSEPKAVRTEKEAPSKEKEAPSKEKEAPSKAKEASSKEKEALSKEKEAPSKEKEAPSKAKEAQSKEKEALSKAKEAQSKEKEAQSKEKEALSKAKEAQSKEKEALSKAKEAQSKAKEAPSAISPIKTKLSEESASKNLDVEKQEVSKEEETPAAKEEAMSEEPSKQGPSKQEPSKQEPSKQEPSKQEPSKQEASKEEPEPMEVEQTVETKDEEEQQKPKTEEKVSPVVEEPPQKKLRRSRSRSGSRSSRSSSDSSSRSSKSRSRSSDSSGSSRSSSSSRSPSPKPRKQQPTKKETPQKDELADMRDESYHTAPEDISIDLGPEPTKKKKDTSKPVSFTRQTSKEDASEDTKPEATDQVEEVVLKPLEPLGVRKRKWGSTRSTINKSTISISTDSLKGIIDVKPGVLGIEPVLDLGVSPDVGNELGEMDEKDKESDKTKENDSLNICRTVLQDVNKSDKSGKKLVEEPTEDQRHVSMETNNHGDVEKVMKKDKAAEQEKPPRQIVSRESRSLSEKVVPVAVLPVDEPEAAERAPSPPRHPVSNVLHIQQLVRPYTLGQLRELLSRTGTLLENGFWIDKIKSHSLAMYETEDQATQTREALHGTRWPNSNPRLLRVDFSTKEEFEFYNSGSEGPFRREAPESGKVEIKVVPARKERRDTEPEKVVTEPAPRNRRTGIKETTELQKEREREKQRREHVREWDRDKVRQSASRSRSRDRDREVARRKRSAERTEREKDRENRRRERSKERRERKQKQEEEEPPAKLLDDLFRKTKAPPCIYWLPLTEEQAKDRATTKKTQQADREKQRDERRRLAEEDRNSRDQPRRDEPRRDEPRRDEPRRDEPRRDEPPRGGRMGDRDRGHRSRERDRSGPQRI